MVAVEDSDHMTMMNENVNWMNLTHSLPNFTLNLGALFCTSTFAFQIYILEKNNTSLLCILCTLKAQIISLLTSTLVHMWYEESTPSLRLPQVHLCYNKQLVTKILFPSIILNTRPILIQTELWLILKTILHERSLVNQTPLEERVTNNICGMF